MNQLDMMDEYDKRIIRTALLNAQSEWLTEADGADSMTARTIAIVVADAFSQEAEKYKTKETNFHDHGTQISDSRGATSFLDEPRADGALPLSGKAG